MHNDLRARHHAPPLQWSNECFELASKQVESCAAGTTKLQQGNVDGESGLHGQNFGNQGSGTPARLALSWYNELVRWVYDFEDPDAVENQMCESFTQMVWFNTQYIGVAQSGEFVVANYFPVGNVEGAYQRNVLPAPLKMMEDSFKGRTAWFSSLTPDLRAFVAGLADCVVISKGADRSACIKEVEAGCSNGGQVCFIRESGDVSTCVKRNFAINRFKRPLKSEFKTRMTKEAETAWQNLPEVHTQFKEIAVSLPVAREPTRKPTAVSQPRAAGSHSVSRAAVSDAKSQPVSRASAAGSRPASRANAAGAAGADAVQQAFARSDENKDGFLQLNELGNIMGSLGMDKKDAGKLMKAVDKNGDGKVAVEEFVQWIFSGTDKASTALSMASTAASSDGGRPPSRPSDAGRAPDEAAAEQAVRHAFNRGDSNEDGFLQPGELEKLMAPTGMDKAQVQRLIKAVDKNADGKVDSNEFLNWVFSGTKMANKTREVIA